MEIENEKGIFDIEKGAVISIERTNPLLSEQGSMSLPYSIKRTDKNDYLLGNPQNFERKDEFQIKQDMNIRSGLLHENATFEMLSIDAEKVEGVFYLYESSFYNKIKEVKLPTVFEGIERWFQPKKESLSEDERLEYVSHILDIFEQMIRSVPDHSGDFTLFPVASDCEFSSRTLWGSLIGTTASQNVINEVYRYYEPGTSNSEIRLKAKESYEYTDDDGNPIRIPVGYGVSPFLRFGYILRKIFEYFDLYLEPTIFETEKVFQRIVVVNNTQDAVMPGYIIESQLVPDCTINDFLDIIREGMCGDFIIDISNKKAKLVLFNDVANSEPDMDLSDYIVSRFEKIEFNQPKQVRLSVGKSLPHAETATDTLDEFIKKYPKYNPTPPLIGSGSEDEGVLPFYSNNAILKVSEPLHEWITSTYKMDFISSMNFDYCTTDEIESEEHKVPFEAPVTIPIIITESDFNSYSTMIIGTLRNLNSLVILDGVNQTEETTECPVILALEKNSGGPRAGVIYADSYISSSLIGSPPFPFIVSNTSFFISLNPWSENGLFNRFWKEYDTLLRKSFHEITFIGVLPAKLLQNFTFDKRKLMHGQPLIPISLKYEMTDRPLIKCEIVFKTGKRYGMNEESNPELNWGELKFFIGKWSMVPDSNYPDSQINFLMNTDYSGTFYLKYRNWHNIDLQYNISFHKVSIKKVTEGDINYNLVELITEGSENIQLHIIDQLSEPEKTFRLLNSELPVVLKQV